MGNFIGNVRMLPVCRILLDAAHIVSEENFVRSGLRLNVTPIKGPFTQAIIVAGNSKQFLSRWNCNQLRFHRYFWCSLSVKTSVHIYFVRKL